MIQHIDLYDFKELHKAMNKRKKLVIALSVVAGLVLIGLAVWFFWLKDMLALSGASPIYVNSVATITGMETGTLPRYAGVVEPQKTHKIERDQSKTLDEVKVVVGDEIHIGDVLFTYNTEEMQLQLDQARLELESIANQISTLNAQKNTLTAEKKKASEDEQLSYTVQIQSIELQIREQEYNSSVKKSEIEKLNTSLSNADVLSEVEGVVKEINITPGTDASGQALPFISILSNGDFRIKGTVSELNRDAVAVGQEVIVHSRVDNTITWKGTVESVDFDNPVTSTSNYYSPSGEGQTKSSKYNFYVVLSSLDGLILGQHVYIEPDTGEADKTLEGLWLPASYVCHDDTGSYVWARNDKEKLEKRTILLGDYDTNNDKYAIKDGITTRDYIAYPEEGLLEGLPTTVDASASIPSPDQNFTDDNGGMDGSMDGAIDGGFVDNVDPAPDGDVDVAGGEVGGSDGGALADPAFGATQEVIIP